MLKIKDNIDLKDLKKYGFEGYKEEQDFKYIELHKYIGYTDFLDYILKR